MKAYFTAIETIISKRKRIGKKTHKNKTNQTKTSLFFYSSNQEKKVFPNDSFL